MQILTPEQRQRRVETTRLWALNNPERYKYSQRNATLRKKYGIGVEEYDALLEKQGGVCAICGVNENYSSWYFAVDHDHLTGEVRGLLCNKCNSAIGQLKDDPALIRKALAYLECR